MKKRLMLLAGLLLCMQLMNACGGQRERESGVLHLEEAFGGLRFDTPVAIRHAGDGSGKLYVVEQSGTIQSVDGDGSAAEKHMFLDLTPLVYDNGWEQGLLGLAFHPDYKTNGKFYVNYTTERTTVIAEYVRSRNNPGQADPGSGRIMLEFGQPYDNHNGGDLAFGPDGYLYIAVGDGGSGGDPQGNGQNPAELLGSILRIDVDRRDGQLEYAIPSDNPFVDSTAGYRAEIFAYGLRNPWRISFDRQTGLLWAADVGQNRTEEINIIGKGRNYGWNVMEGTACYIPENCASDGLTMPVWEYNATERGASVTGGYVYRGTAIPQLNGKYMFSDFMDGRFWTLGLDDAGAAAAQQLSFTMPGITSFGEDERGELYACHYEGIIYRVSE